MIQALQLILALSFLVIIHELGHFTFARIFGVRVEKFYMFFDWKFSILKVRYVNIIFSLHTSYTRELQKPFCEWKRKMNYVRFLHPEGASRNSENAT